MILIWHAILPFYNLCRMIPRFEQTRDSVGQINELMELKPETTNYTASVRLPKIEGVISFRNVVLRYARDQARLSMAPRIRILDGGRPWSRPEFANDPPSVMRPWQSIDACSSS